MDSEQPNLSTEPVGLGSGPPTHRHPTWRRRIGVAVSSTVVAVTALSATSLPAAAVVAPTSLSTAGPGVVLTDLASGYGGWSPGDRRSDPWGSGGSTTTVDSNPASAPESKGVVLIDTVLGYQGGQGAGTGVVLTSSGEVLTNYHVVQGATSVKVTVAATGRTYTATVVGRDKADDVALLQLAGASNLDTVAIDDDTVSVGDRVTAVGNAGGTSNLTAADGTVTALGSTITTTSGSGAAGETLEDLIETSADVVSGDSGGPLLDDEGEVIGINTAASTGSEINGYAIGIHDALSVVRQIRAGQESGTVQIGATAFLGVQVSNATPTGAGNGYRGWDTGIDTGPVTGALVAGVVEDSPAAVAGLAEGDTITAIGGETVGSAEEVATLLAGHDAGDSVRVSWTDSLGDSRSATVTLAASPVA